MKTKFLTTLISTLALTGVYATSAQAFTFTTNYTTTDKKDWKSDILLNSVEFGNKTYTNFSLVNRVDLLENDLWTGGNTGAASSDLGDKATVGIKKEAPTGANLATSLGNLYLSSIVDTEDTGSFKMNVFFNTPAKDFLFFERGMNSKLRVQALDKKGNLIGNSIKLNSSQWNYAGYKLDTREIGDDQKVGSLGVSLFDLGVTDTSSISGLQLISKSDYVGPDFKVIAVASVPEPTTVLGLGLVGAALAMSRRKKAH